MDIEIIDRARKALAVNSFLLRGICEAVGLDEEATAMTIGSGDEVLGKFTVAEAMELGDAAIKELKAL